MSLRIPTAALLLSTCLLAPCAPRSLAQEVTSSESETFPRKNESGMPHYDAAQQLFRRFVKRLAEDAPVAGVFEIRGKISEEALADLAGASRKDAATRGLGYIAPDENPALVCRWAWDGKREMLESSAKSTVFESFYSTPDAYLQGMVEGNYNLSGPKAPYPVRPASFYFLVGTRSWFTLAEDAEVGFDRESTPSREFRTLRVTVSPGYVRLFIREGDCRLQGHEVYLNDKIFQRLQITSFFRNSDGQAFPDGAKLEVFSPKTGNVIRSDQLHSVNILFPKQETELRSAFAMELPSGTEVHDLLLNKELTLTSAMPVADVMNGAVDERWASMEGNSVTPLVLTTQMNYRRWLLWGNVIVLAAISAWFFYRIFRRRA